MTTYKLSISTKYVPDWGIKEGVREILQNAIDAEKHGCKMSLSYNNRSKTLKVHSLGAYLNPSSLLMGETTKAGDVNQIGEFGEGYKLGTLALLREGKRVMIFNRCAENPQKWVAEIAFSEEYQANVIVIKSTNITPKCCDRLTFQVQGITLEEWRDCQKLLLSWGAYGSYEIYETKRGRVLAGEHIKGCIFVSGIFIYQVKDLHYGYDFNPGYITLNRDRHTISAWSLECTTSYIWNELVDQNEEHLIILENMLLNDARDIRSMSDDYICSHDLMNKLIDRFVEKYGSNAHPVAHAEEAKSLSFSNIIGIPTSHSYAKLLENRLGKVEEIIKEKQRTPNEEVAYFLLNENERDNLDLAINLIKPEVIHPFDIKVVNFPNEDVLGVCKVEESIILIARKILKDIKDTMATLVHEYSHIAGPDGHATFHWEERKLWAKIVGKLLEEKRSIQ